MGIWQDVANIIHADVMSLTIVLAPIAAGFWFTQRHGAKKLHEETRALNSAEHMETARKLDIVVTEVAGFREWRDEHGKVHDQINERLNRSLY